jgi:multiple sugar transport system ATP-binding protein
VREGAEAQLWLDVRRIHLFDPETGDNLTLPADPLGSERHEARQHGQGAVGQGASGQGASGQGDPLVKQDDHGAGGEHGAASEHGVDGESEPPRSGGAHRA